MSALADDDEDFDDLPSTHLDDESYEEFVGRELDARGRVRGDPPVGTILVVLIVLVAVAAVVWLR
jgi:hypothetical protein